VKRIGEDKDEKCDDESCWKYEESSTEHRATLAAIENKMVIINDDA
jgi:hypothetical protein